MADRHVVIGAARAVTLAVASLAVAVAIASLAACGGGHTSRDEKVCRSCTAGVDQGCFDECQRLCLPDDPNCDTRCAAQCDECRRDLVCSPCRASCTGATLRCAPTNEVVACDDGTYGGAAVATAIPAGLTAPSPPASGPR